MKHARLLTSLFLVLCLAAATALAQDGAAAPAPGEPVQLFWKTATLAPAGIGWAKHMTDVIFPVMEETTKGNLKVKVYWGGVMGDEEDYIKKIRIGQLQGAGLSAQGTVQACPEMAVLELPFLFRNYQEVDYVRVKMEGTFDRLFAKQDFFLVGWIDQDFDQIYSANRPIATVEDFAKCRFLTWYGPMEEELLSVLGADMVPVNVPEMSTTIRQKVVDAAIGPAVFVVGAQLYSTLRYVNPIKIRYSPATIIFTLETWNSQPKEYIEEFFKRRLELGWRYSNLVRADNERYVDALVKYGLKRVDMSPEELDRLKVRTREVWDRTTGKLFAKETLDEVLGHLADYQAGKRLVLADLLKMSNATPESLDPELKERLLTTIRESIEAFGQEEGAVVDLKGE
ncbi:MAG: TRAP transporter substrate-binding protein DctP [Proteobacteria bacterium]|nr:TRAP transporter substrate-binding protein DctP [Pseudomonadota bacterium]